MAVLVLRSADSFAIGSSTKSQTWAAAMGQGHRGAKNICKGVPRVNAFSEAGTSIRSLSNSNWLLQRKKDIIEEEIMVGGKIEYNT